MATKAFLKTVFFLFLISISALLVSAVDVTDTGQDVLPSTSSVSDPFLGLRFTAKGGVCLKSVTRVNGVTGSYAIIVNHDTANELARCDSWAGDICTFDTPLEVSSGVTYRVLVGSNGSSFTRYYESPSNPSFPFTGTNVNFTSGCSMGFAWTLAQGCEGGTESVYYNVEAITSGDCPSDSGFQIKSYDAWNGSEITNFNATIVNDTSINTYEVTNGSLFINEGSGFYNITIESGDNGGYRAYTRTDYNTSVNLDAYMTKFYNFGEITYSNYTTFENVDYVRSLRYSFNYTCDSRQNATVYLSINQNASVDEVNNLSCDNTTQVIQGNYGHTTEGEYNISLYFVSPIDPLYNNEETQKVNFTSDLYSPSINNYTIEYEGNFGVLNVTVFFSCNDNIAVNLTVNLTVNDNSFYLQNITESSNVSTSAPVINGDNEFYGYCSDLFSTATDTFNITAYRIDFLIVDEVTGEAFDINNVSAARVYFDDNSSYYDFKGNSSTIVNFTTFGNDKLRFVFSYYDGTIITRYIDVSKIPRVTRICAFEDSQTDYEQLIISSTEKYTALKNVFANCYVAADYTRFAYQDSQSLKAYTIDSNYAVQVLDDSGSLYTIASLDGSISSYINIDILEFNKDAFDVSIVTDSVSFTRNQQVAGVIRIDYLNLAGDNTDLDISITRLDTNDVVYTDSSLSNVNNFTLYFDYSTLSNVTNQTLFMFTGTKENEAGTEVFKRYFNVNASSGILNNAVAFGISLLLVVFGLTFTISRLSFSWFGVFIMIGAISITALAVGAWFITLLQVIETIMLVYIIIIMWTQNYPTIT